MAKSIDFPYSSIFLFNSQNKKKGLGKNEYFWTSYRPISHDFSISGKDTKSNRT